jgi:hypothetical protein
MFKFQLEENLEYAIEMRHLEEKQKRYEGRYNRLDSGGKKFAIGAAYALLGVGLAAVPILLLAMYRKHSDKCAASCNDNELCTLKCYKNVVENIITKVQKDKGGLHTITDPKKRARRENALNKELNKWKKKLMKFNAKIAKQAGKQTKRDLKKDAKTQAKELRRGAKGQGRFARRDARSQGKQLKKDARAQGKVAYASGKADSKVQRAQNRVDNKENKKTQKQRWKELKVGYRKEKSDKKAAARDAKVAGRVS